MSVPYDFDIAIIGDGITGLSAAMHLQKLGFSRLCVFAKENAGSTTAQSAGLVAGGLLDNFTRLSHRHGSQLARDLWTFTHQAFDALREHCQDHKIPFDSVERLRWVLTPQEAREAQQATAQLNQLGFGSVWQDSVAEPLLGIQHDGPNAGFVDPNLLLAQLRSVSTALPRYAEAVRLRVESGAALIDHASGTVRAECVVCAQHLAIGSLIPGIQEALVAFADQWSEFQIPADKPSLPWPPGTVFSWQHSHIWGVVSGPHHLRLGGARYLRPMAGIEAQSAPYEERIRSHLADAWHKLWPSLRIEPTGRGYAGLDCLPCDELPIVGPMFGESRLLLATGYMGQGLALGFLAGRCLAELIAGKPSILPRSLWPERLRSLPGAAIGGEE